jgi:hypothetical protein
MYVMNKKMAPKVVPDATSWGIMMEMTLVICPRRWSTRRHLRIWEGGEESTLVKMQLQAKHVIAGVEYGARVSYDCKNDEAGVFKRMYMGTQRNYCRLSVANACLQDKNENMN